MCYSADGRHLLTGGYDGAAKLWDAASGKELYQFRGHSNFLWSATFSSDGRRVLTSCGGFSAAGKFHKGNDFLIRMWAMPDAHALAEYALTH